MEELGKHGTDPDKHGTDPDLFGEAMPMHAHAHIHPVHSSLGMSAYMPAHMHKYVTVAHALSSQRRGLLPLARKLRSL